jgi:hypothetical protein
MSRILVLSFVEILPLPVETEADSATEGKIPRICSVPEFGFILGAVTRFHDGPDMLVDCDRRKSRVDRTSLEAADSRESQINLEKFQRLLRV